jgi:hypothetical protein
MGIFLEPFVLYLNIMFIIILAGGLAARNFYRNNLVDYYLYEWGLRLHYRFRDESIEIPWDSITRVGWTHQHITIETQYEYSSTTSTTQAAILSIRYIEQGIESLIYLDLGNSFKGIEESKELATAIMARTDPSVQQEGAEADPNLKKRLIIVFLITIISIVVTISLLMLLLE